MKKIIAGNWKMNFSPQEAKQYVEDMSAMIKNVPNHFTDSAGAMLILFTPPYLWDSNLLEHSKQNKIYLGSQNAHWQDRGAFTGELSPQVLKQIGLEWILLGHSERRQWFGETNETAAQRLDRCLSHQLNVVFCIGETLAQRENNEMHEVLTQQLKPCLPSIEKYWGQSTFAIAYEPVWAIGTGKTATPIEAMEAHTFIRSFLTTSIGAGIATRIPLLYGGSVTPDNARSLLHQPEIDGVLVGGASLKAQSFFDIFHSVL